MSDINLFLGVCITAIGLPIAVYINFLFHQLGTYILDKIFGYGNH